MNAIKNFLTHKDTEAWLWMTVNSFVLLVGTYFADVNPLYAAPIIAIMNLITKWVNVRFIKE